MAGKRAIIIESFYIFIITVMNKTNLMAALADKLGISKRLAGDMINCFVDLVTASLQKGEKVSIAGFGVWAVSHRAARAGRNPQTGETIQIKARKVPTFKAGKALKVAVN